MGGALGERHPAALTAGVHRHHDQHAPVRPFGDAVDLDPPFVPGGRHVVHVAPDPVVAPVEPPADVEHRVELDARMADGHGGVDIAACDRLGEEARRFLARGFHARIMNVPE